LGGGFVDGGFFCVGFVLQQHLLDELSDCTLALDGVADFGGWSEEA
jgi:hypothetical protein